ncbi:MAG: AarF/ABC1/UbiB kinase family protein [Polyangiales bacterium]
MAEDGKLPGRFRRTLQTAWLGGSVGGRMATGKLADAFRSESSRAAARSARAVDAAKNTVRTMSELRGPIMKVGQLLSTHTHVLPEEMRAILRPLEEGVPPMPFEAARKVVEAELGEPLETAFREFGETAVAAASLGQVHRAKLPDGTEVAVKVQYPGAADSVHADAKNLRTGATLAKTLVADVLRQSRLDMTPIADELAEHLLQETDYCREAYNAKLLRRLFDASSRKDVFVPRVHDSHSSLRVITYDWVEGDGIDAGLTHAEVSVRERTVEQLCHSFWHQLYRGGVLHADPHPGNYRVLPDGRLGLLDFGCVKVFSDTFHREFHRMAQARYRGDRDTLRASMLALELVDDASREDQFEEMERLARYMSVGITEDAPFDFGTYDYVTDGRDLVRFFLARRTVPPAQRDFLFLTRVVLGYYEYFSRARARMHFRDMVAPYLEAPHAGRLFPVPPYDAS